jgi:dTDP-4-amino-4,6-dideoxygalactose transaminase
MRSVTDGIRRTPAVSNVEGWLRERFPHHRHIYFGVSGTTMLHDALKSQSRTWVVLPGFLCPKISAAAACARKQLIHIDADRRTELPDVAQLVCSLASRDASDTVVLIDHSFGYPFPAVARLRREFPKLLIIEDLARALGVRINGQYPGEHSDWILLSMYKTVPGSINGAVLLSKTPLPIPQGPRVPAMLRERVARIEPLRSIYRVLQRGTSGEFRSRLGQLELSFPDWSPTYGFPNDLCLSRFATELTRLDNQAAILSAIAEELTAGLSEAGINCIAAAAGCQSAGHFVSFEVRQQHGRDQVLTSVCKKGLFIGRSYDVVSAHYRSFQETFPAGYSNSEYLAEHMAHIRVALYPRTKQRRRLVSEVCKLAAEHGSECKNFESHLLTQSGDS